MNNFLLWIEQSNINNTLEYNAFDESTQRTGGFVSGSSISSIQMNSILRQVSLVSAAFMNAIAPTSTLNYRSSLSDMMAEITNGLKAVKPTNAGTADNATNVTTNINGKAISTIFESNGTTVKNATNAANANNATTATSAGAATNVTTNINGKAITTIFESNGTTVKNATNASSATNATNSTNATNATNVNITTETADDNVVKFKVGNGTGYNKTINNVAHATSADTATNATNATNAGNATTVTNGVYTTDINKPTETKFGSYIVRKEILLKNERVNVGGTSPQQYLYYTGNPIGRKFRVEYYLYNYGGVTDMKCKKSVEFEIQNDSQGVVLDEQSVYVSWSGNQGLYLCSLSAKYSSIDGVGSGLFFTFTVGRVTSLSSTSAPEGKGVHGVIYALYEII